jgi:V8-like Glu-specific endopeptidase
MALNVSDEPHCWVCKLDCYWEDGTTTVGTGFLANLRDSAKHCIMTAGHNLVNPSSRVKEVEVTFPRGKKMTALGNQCFVSTIYREAPDERNDKDDYGLLAIDLQPGEKKIGGFGFSTVIPEKDLIRKPVKVYGYPKGGSLQGFESRLSRNKLREKPEQLFHSVETVQGVSGGPVWITHQDDYYTAIGIHNYGGSEGNKDPQKRATRLTVKVLRDMVGWAGDCRLGQSIEGSMGSKIGRTYLKASTGKRTTVQARRGRDRYTGFDFIPIEAPPYQEQETKPRELKYRYLIAPTATVKPVYLKFDPNSNTKRQVAFAEAANARNPSGEEDAALHFAINKKANKLITVQDESNQPCTGPFEVSVFGKGLLLRIRYTGKLCECDCGKESSEVDFVLSSDVPAVKIGSGLYLSSNVMR